MCNDILVTGGSSSFEGLKQRLNQEIKSSFPSKMKENVKIHLSNKKNLAWLGGSIFASSIQYESDCWINLDDYNEYGTNIVHRKYF